MFVCLYPMFVCLYIRCLSVCISDYNMTDLPKMLTEELVYYRTKKMFLKLGLKFLIIEWIKYFREIFVSRQSWVFKLVYSNVLRSMFPNLIQGYFNKDKHIVLTGL